MNASDTKYYDIKECWKTYSWQLYYKECSFHLIIELLQCPPPSPNISVHHIINISDRIAMFYNCSLIISNLILKRKCHDLHGHRENAQDG